VNSVCNHVLLEHYRSGSKNVPLESDHLELPDKVLNLENLSDFRRDPTHGTKRLVAAAAARSAILRSVFWKKWIRMMFASDSASGRDYLRVLLYRGQRKVPRRDARRNLL